MEKLYNSKGQVAVAISPEYGAGWSTWSDVNPMDKRYNQLILDGDIQAAIELAEAENHDSFGLTDCYIEWLDPGTRFTVEEYNGYESIRTLVDLQYTT